ncbi:MAG: cytochrome c [Rhodothermales bacterium]|nr:cytochrome c [Rhodothermales bacterium]
MGKSGALRFPDLSGIASRAESRIDGMSGLEYLAQSIYDPDIFIVEGFNPGMPRIDKPPIGLNDQEILAVLAYLQSLGGTPTVTLATDLGYTTAEQATASPAQAAASGASTGTALDGPGVFAAYGCAACHNILTADRGVGPSLHDTGSRMTKPEIYEAIVDPDAIVAEGYPAGVMGATLSASGFYQKVSTEELKALVDYLADQKGG